MPLLQSRASAIAVAVLGSITTAEHVHAQNTGAVTLDLKDAGHPPDRGLANLGIIFGTAGTVALYGANKWWQDGFNGKFNSRNEAWFGHSTYTGGADKLGHFYMNYAGTRLFTRAFQWAGNSASESRSLAAWLMLGTFTGVEILDGFSKEWSFSREDAIINALGAGIGLLMETHPRLDQLFDFRIHYWPSSGSGFNPFGDYSGQTYVLAMKARGVPKLQSHPILRYLELAVGYGTRGYEGHPGGQITRGDRNVYVGISLNLSAILEDGARRERDRGIVFDATRTTLEFIQVPGAAIYTKHSLD